MLDLYSFPTPNGRKVHLMLEELGLPYRAHPVNILKGEQFEPEFLAISPNNRIPALVDHDGPGGQRLSLFESGAILWYLAEKTGKLLPSEPHGRYDALQWLMFQMGGVGPMFGQANHFLRYAPEEVPYGKERYSKETLRLLRVMDRQLAKHDYLAAGTYTVADVATYPWVVSHDVYREREQDVPQVQRWVARIQERPAVSRAWAVMADAIPRDKAAAAEEAREILFGKKQFEER